MVQNKLSEQQVIAKAETLSFPKSVVEYFQGYLGIPSYGFPEPLRSKIVANLPTVEGRPGASMPPLDFDTVRSNLKKKFPWATLRETDLLSHAMYPKEFEEFKTFSREFADVSVLPTRYFFAPMVAGEEVSFEIEKGKKLFCRLVAVGEVDNAGYRTVYFELNGTTRAIKVDDKSVPTIKVP
jgi:pyruvate carboxylase